MTPPPPFASSFSGFYVLNGAPPLAHHKKKTEFVQVFTAQIQHMTVNWYHISYQTVPRGCPLGDPISEREV